MVQSEYTLGERLAQIREALGKGAKNFDEASKFISDHYSSLAASTIKTYSFNHGIEFPKEEPPTEAEKAEVIRQALDGGVNSIEGLFRAIDSTPTGLEVVCRRHEIDLPEDIIPYQTKPKIDGLIQFGPTLKCLAIVEGIAPQGVRQYLKTSGQYKRWAKIRAGKPRYPRGI